MKKSIVLLAFLSAGCTVYFGGASSDRSSGEVSTLSIVNGGGYLSSEDHNEITPFLFTSASGEKYLFYASDADGTYDIYYARMTADGEFSNAVKMTDKINTSNCDELNPLVLIYNNSNYITFLRFNSNTNLVTYRLTDYFGYASMSDDSNSFGCVSCGLAFDGAAPHLALVHSDGAVAFEAPNTGYSMLLWGGTVYDAPHTPFTISSLNSFTVETNLSVVTVLNTTTTNIFKMIYSVCTVETNGKGQLAAELVSGIYSIIHVPGYVTYETNYVTNSGLVPYYLSQYDDNCPMVDFNSKTYDVYFSSKRRGAQDQYDLYRYSVRGLSTVITTNGFVPGL